MEEKYEQIENFLAVLDELVTGKYATADQKIEEALMAIGTSEELTKLFDAVTSKFDYPSAKKAYLRFPAEADGTRGVAFLPSERGDVLAFVFCIMVELSSGAMPFGDFLLRYFYEDGSYTASYFRFADRMLRPFRDIIKSCYPECSRRGKIKMKREEEANAFRLLAEKAALERERISKIMSGNEDAARADTLLAELYAAAGREDAVEIQALAIGYRYFLAYTGMASQESEELFALSEKL